MWLGCLKVVAVATALALFAGLHVAVAQPAAAAEIAFREGKRLMGTGDYAAACLRFEESQRLDPSPGTLLNLGDCYDKLGRTASAWSAFVEADAAATRAGQTSRAAEARRRATALEPRLSRVIVELTNPLEGVDIRLDGNPVTALAGVGIPLDPGPHAVTATAAGHRDWSSSLTVAPGPATATVRITLEPGEPATEQPPGGRRGGSRLRHPVLLTLAGASVVTLTVGALLDITAYNDYQACRDRGACDTDTEVDGIERRMLVGDVLIGVGIASAAAGIAWYVLGGPDEAPVSVALDPRAATLQVSGRF